MGKDWAQPKVTGNSKDVGNGTFIGKFHGKGKGRDKVKGTVKNMGKIDCKVHLQHNTIRDEVITQDQGFKQVKEMCNNPREVLDSKQRWKPFDK